MSKSRKSSAIPSCDPRYGWEPKSSGKGCKRVKPSAEAKHESSVALSMPASPGLTLQEHQTRVKEKLKDQKGLVVFHGLGSGKTLTAVNAAEEYGGAVVVTPASLQDNFKKELEKYGAKGTYDVYSYEKFRNDPPSLTGRMLIADEAHRIRNSQTQAHKAVAAAAQESEKVLLLTATPMQNKPHELAPLINIASGENLLPVSEGGFKSEFIGKKKPPLWKRPFLKANFHSVDEPRNLEEFNRRASKYVDHYSPKKEGYPSVTENTVEVPMSKSQAQTYRMFEKNLDAVTQYKMKKNLPLSKQESSNLNAFINAQRQITNSSGSFNVNDKTRSPKTIEIADRIQSGKGKSLVYSNFLDSGIAEISGELKDRKLSHRIYTGQLNRKEKDEIIKDYNDDKFKVLIVSSAGGEGLDLKKTRQVHIMEPHWNESKIDQVTGRAVRYQSHAGLKPADQTVEIYKYLSIYPRNFFGMKSKKVTADQYLTNLSRDKKALNEAFLAVVKKDSVGKPCGESFIAKEKKCNQSASLSSPPSSNFKAQLRPDIKALRSVQKEKNRLRHKRMEAAAIVSSKSGDVVYRGREGSPVGCEITDMAAIRGNIIVHNHPTHVTNGRTNSFSLDDIQVACQQEAAEMIAVNEVAEYSMKPPSGGWNATYFNEKVHPAFVNAHKKTSEEIIRSVKRGELKLDWLGRIKNKDFDPYDQVWRKVAEETGMTYRKMPVITRTDTLKKTSRVYSELEKVTGKVVERAFPMGVFDVEAKVIRPQAIAGHFLGSDKRVYSFDIDLNRNKLSYQLNTFRTPKSSMRKDAKSKTPECEIGTPCQGARGVGCISRKKKCEQKLNRYSTSDERAKLGQLAQKEFEVTGEKSFEDQLRAKTIRELQPLAKQAGIVRGHHYKKEALVQKLAELQKLESTDNKGKSGEEEMLSTLLKRKKQRDEFLDVAPITANALPMTKEELAEKRNLEMLKKRRQAALKKGFSVLFPGGSKVIDDFSKAIDTNDRLIAGLVAGVVILKLYNSSKKEYEQNYQKSTQKEGREAVYNDKNVPTAVRNVEDFYEAPSMTVAEGARYADSISDRNLAGYAVKGLKDRNVQEALKDIQEGGDKEDTLPYQKDRFTKKIQKEAKDNVQKAEADLVKQQRRFKVADQLANEAVTRNKAIEDERSLLRQEIARIEKAFPKEEDRKNAKVSIKAPVSLRKSESFNKIEQELKKSSKEQDEQVRLKRQELLNDGMSENDVNNELTSYAQSLRDKVVIDRLQKEPPGKLTYAELVQSEKSLNSLLSNNLVTHQNALAGKASVARALVEMADDKLKDTKKEWGAIAEGTATGKKALEKKAVEAAKAAINKRRVEGIKTKPLIPDFGEVKNGKLSRYQAWALTNYLEDRNKSLLDANNDIRQTDRKKYSLNSFKENLTGVIVVGSETGKGSEAAEVLKQKIPSLKNGYVVGLENDYSMNASMSESKKSMFPYIGRAGKYAAKAVPSSNNIPGVNPAQADNDDATRVAAQIIAMQEYGIPARVVAQGIGGNILREAMDIVASSNDPKALKNTKTAIFGSPRLGFSKYKEVQNRDHVFYGGEDFIAKQFGGKGKEMIPGVAKGSYKDYLNATSAIGKIEDILKKDLK